MKQQATVELVNGEEAVISVRRRTACAGDCDSCKGCAHPGETIRVTAINAAKAMPGDVVTVESGSGIVLGLAAMLYLMPLMTMGLGYAIGDTLLGFTGEGPSIALAFLGLAGGLVLCIALSRGLKRKGKMNFTITEIVGEE